MSDSNEKKIIGVETPPKTFLGILRRLGPGLIVAGSIVGSGELIATTSTGAQAGFALLWLIIIGCVIKVFVQVEMGRYAIVSGKTTMTGLAEVPGPRIKGRGNWLIWFWFVMFLASIAQLGGIVGGVGQALSISAPITSSGTLYNEYAEAETQLIVRHKELQLSQALLESAPDAALETKIGEDVERIVDLEIQNAESAAALAENADLKNKTEYLTQQQQVFELIKAAVESGNGATADNVLRTRQNLIVDLYEFRDLSQSISNLESQIKDEDSPEGKAKLDEELQAAQQALQAKLTACNERGSALGMSELTDAYVAAYSHDKLSAPIDDKIWAGIVTAITVIILVNGRFGLIQSFSTTLVCLFTIITIANLAFLQMDPTWGVSVSNIVSGLSFRLSSNGDTMSSLSMALKAFGIIGVGAAELVTYPYWCLEKGYAKFTGSNDGSEAWLDRAKGWLKVMRWDAWFSMCIYTFATIAFYLLGAAILGRTNLQPEGTEMIRYLSVMYEPVFGTIAQTMFLFGAFAVLYSTFFVANASHARVFSDAVRVMGLVPKDEKSYRLRVKILSGAFPCLCFLIYCFIPKPAALVFLSGLMQALMLPMLSAAALYYRYFRTIPELKPSSIWDFFLWASAIGMLIAGGWLGWSQISKLIGF